MIKSRYLIPLYISEKSRDIHVFLRLIDLVANNSKAKSDDFINILNPDRCPDILLPILSSYLGYEYDYNETYDKNRIILRSYKDMIKNKGSVVGIQLAIAVAITMLIDKSIVDAQNLFDVAYYDKFFYCSNCKYVSYTHFDECPNCGLSDTAVEDNEGAIVAVIEYPIYSAKIYDLIEAVRPAGTNCNIYSGTLVEQLDNIGISDFISLQSKYLNAGSSEVGGVDSIVGFTPILKESILGLKYCEDCGNQFKEEHLVCPFCGSENIKDTNDSSLRLLYRLYNNDKQFNSIVESIISSIDSGDTVSNSDIVGIILNIHVNNSQDYTPTDDKTYYYYVYNPTTDTTYDPNKTYYYLNFNTQLYIQFSGYYVTHDETVISSHTYYSRSGDTYTVVIPIGTENPHEEGWYQKGFDPLVEYYERGQFDRHKTYYTYDSQTGEYVVFTGTEFVPGTVYYEHTDEWKINLLQSFIFGLKPYIKISNNQECMEYTIREILDNLVELNTSTLSTLRNKYKQQITYKLIKDEENRYAIRANSPDAIEGETIILNHHNYMLHDVTITSIDYENIPNTNTIQIADVYTDNNEYSFQMGSNSYYVPTNDSTYDSNKTYYTYNTTTEKFEEFTGGSFVSGTIYYEKSADGYSNKTIEEPETETDSDKTVSQLMEHKGNTAQVVANSDGYYFHVCRVCNETIIKQKSDSVVICPRCGGVDTTEIRGSSGSTTISQTSNPTILVGSYIIDLYFN